MVPVSEVEWSPLRCCPGQNPEERTWDLFVTIRATDRKCICIGIKFVLFTYAYMRTFENVRSFSEPLCQREHQLRKVVRRWSS